MPDADYPNIRASSLCPLCCKNKDTGLVTCWSCYRACGLRYGNAEAEYLIARAEDKLREEGQSQRT